MRFRNSRLRTKIVALLLSLTALWVFAAWVTLREGVNLLFVSTLDRVASSSDPLLVELQAERRLSEIYLAAPTQQRRESLAAQRARTDEARAVMISDARNGAVRRAASETLDERLDIMINRLNGLNQERFSVDAGLADRHRVGEDYSAVIESVFHMYDAIASLDDEDFATDVRIEIAVNRSWELLAREDALVAGALTSGRISATDQTEIIQAVGARRLNTTRSLVDLQDADRQAYQELTTNQRLAEVSLLEDTLLRTDLPGQRAPLTADRWQRATEPALAEMRQSIQRAGDRLVERATPIAGWVIVRLLLAGGLGFLAVVASIVVSINTARALVKQLERLRDAAHELSDKRLPRVVERLGHGEQVDVAAEAPPLEVGSDEVGQVSQAFNAVQETAIRTAVEQAELRRGIRDILLSLARRTQTLVRRQLTILDVMERRELDPTELEDLFRIDHLATRMRRNAENLIVLSGATPALGWRRSVAMVDVLRAAVAEVEDYSRVNVLPTGRVALVGRAVGDVTHLLAELIENAVTFSPSYTTVEVGGRMAASGYAIEIEDRGLGMTDENLVVANEQIAASPEFNLSSTARLGLFVVSRLADRYGIKVSLKHSAYGGTTAVVLIPRDLVVEDVDIVEAPQDDRAAGPLVAAGLTTGRDAEGMSAAAHGLALVNAVTRRDGTAAPAVDAAPVPDSPAAVEPPASRAALPRRIEPANGTAERTGADGLPPARPRAERVTSEESMTTPEASHTPSGLPVRVPQANLVAPLRTDASSSAKRVVEDEDEGRSPEEIRRSLGAYQTGTQRGRFDAAKVRPDTDSMTPPPAADDE